MHPILSALKYLCLVLLVATGVACSSDQPTPGGGEYDPDNTQATFLQITLGRPDISRAGNPTGGETGDGMQVGINHENDIHTLALFIYEDNEGRSLNNNPSTPFVSKVYLNESALAAAKLPLSSNPYSITYKFKVSKFEPAATQRIAVVVNANENISEVNDLGTLRTFILDESVKQQNRIADSDWFVMANAFTTDGNINLPAGVTDPDLIGTESHPLVGEVSVERLTARIDLFTDSKAKFDSENSTNGYYREGNGYLDPDNYKFNGQSVIRYPVYERNAAGNYVKSAEVRLTHVLPVNVMQHPSFAFKHVTAGTDIPADILSLNVCGNENMVNGTPTNYVVEPRTASKASVTVPADWFGSTAAMALTPASFTDANSVGAMAARWSRGTCSDDPNTDYAILTYANENTQHKDVLRTDILTGLALRALYVPSKVYGDAALTEVAAYIPGTDLWRMSPTSLTVSDADCVYFNNEAAANAFAAANPQLKAIVSMIPKGICYYNIWIRHARNSDADPQRIPMEYGIVRNNIYQLKLTFHGPGSQKIIEREPEYVSTRIFVRRWNFIRHPEIIM